MIQCRRYLVAGLVQGVFYRQSTQAQASKLGISGWVRNLADGRVEVFACGSQELLRAMEQWLSVGPRMARVESVQTFDAGDEEKPVDFQIRY